MVIHSSSTLSVADGNPAKTLITSRIIAIACIMNVLAMHFHSTLCLEVQVWACQQLSVLQAVMLDEVMSAALQPQQQHIVQFETRSLRDARQLLASVTLSDAIQFIEQNPHPRCETSLLIHSVLGRNASVQSEALSHPGYT